MKLFLDVESIINGMPSNESVVDILTSDTGSSVDIWSFDKRFNKFRSNKFAVNYGDRKGDNSPCVRGFVYNGLLYEICIDSSFLIEREPIGNLYYDRDKLCDSANARRIFTGTGDEFIKEFLDNGYSIRE